ncbi:nucleotide exchange factor GrpE [Micromonospora sp. WMMD718]|uniref:nucleotide exchange factor GrpE n=1 Tax=Micromonospora TaxID=1873 RepID=UPI00064BF2AF|nr:MULTISPECIES: nucleotide exchange factor GrpE [unclassified Micromonospora]MDG4751601.1 nucleotide exchange factor GrpE [Micromonospora sp. WMMD718]
MSTPSDTTPEHDTGRGDEPTTATTGDSPADAGPTAAELQDRWRRAVADLDNLRKRYERQLAEQARTERARTAAAFLPVLDNLELALQHAAADPASIVAGVQAVREQAVHTLAGLGYQRIDAVGERFDPARHEAAQAVPAGDGVQPGTVAAVLRPGYTDRDGTLLRPAVVAVARNDD